MPHFFRQSAVPRQVCYLLRMSIVVADQIFHQCQQLIQRSCPLSRCMGMRYFPVGLAMGQAIMRMGYTAVLMHQQVSLHPADLIHPVKFVFRVPLLHIVANNSIMLPKV